MMDGGCNNKFLERLSKQLKKESCREMELSMIECHVGIAVESLQLKQPRDTFQFAKINTADHEILNILYI